VFFVCLFILDEKDLHLMGQHFAIHPLKVSSDLVCGLLHVALLAYTHRKTCVRLHPTVTFFFTRLDLVTSSCAYVQCAILHCNVNAYAKFCMFQTLVFVLTAPPAYYIQNLLCIYLIVYLFIYLLTD